MSAATDSSERPAAASLPARAQGTDGSRRRRILLVLAVYVAVAMIMTYPVAMHMSTRIAGTNVDEGTFLWNTWWLKSSLIDRGVSPFFADVLFYPLGMSTALYTASWMFGALALPLTLAAGPIIATNLALLAGYVLGAFGTFLLARDRLALRGWRGRPALLAAFVAGIIYAFVSSNVIHAIIGEYNFANSQWLPFAALYFLRTLERPGRRAPLLVALFALFAAWTDLNYVVYLMLFVITVLGFAAARRSTVFSRALLGRLVLALAIFVLGFAPLAIPVITDTLTSGSPLVLGWGAGDLNVMDLLAPFIPSIFHPVFGDAVAEANYRLTFIQFGFAGLTILALSFAGAVIGRRRDPAGHPRGTGLDGTGLWVTVAVVFWLFALGPLLHINGQEAFDLDGLRVTVPLPFIIVHYLPFLKSSRYPFRFSVFEFMALAVLAAFAWQAIASRLNRRAAQAALTAAVCGLILFENAVFPLPTNNVVPPEPYNIIAADPGDFTVLQVPLAWRDGFQVIGPERTLVQAYQIGHGKNIIGGNTSRAPGETIDYFTHAPIITSILNYEEGRTQDPAIDAGDRALAPALLSFLNVRYIVVHSTYVSSSVDTYIQENLPVERVAEGTGRETASSWHVAEDGKWVVTGPANTDWVLYKVKPAPQGPPLAIDLGTNSAHLHQASGWSYDESMGDTSYSWVDGKDATALIRLDQPVTATLTLRASPFTYEGAPPQQMTVAVNGQTVGDFDMAPGWSEYEMVIPEDALRSGMNTIKISFSNTASPSQVWGSTDRRQLSGAVDWIKLEPQ